MKYRFLLSLFVFAAFCNLLAQVDAEDPFRGNYLLGQSSEILLLSGANGNVGMTIFDINGAVEAGGIFEAASGQDSDPWGVFGEDSQIDAASGDFDGDGRDEFVGAWEGPQRSVTLYIPHFDPQSLSWSNATRLRVQDAGFPTLFDIDDFFLRRAIRVVSGQFDDDNDLEFVLAYWADDGATEGGPIQIILYDSDGTLTPQPVAQIADERLEPFIDNAGPNLERGVTFDLATGDFDRDGADEIILLSVDQGPQGGGSNDDFGWGLIATVYDYDGGSLTASSRSSEPILSVAGNSNDFLYRLAVATGDFNGDFYDDVVFGYELKPTNESAFAIYLQTLMIATDLDSVTAVGSPTFVRSGRGQDGWPMTMTTGDVDYDGRDEIIHASKSDLRVYKTDSALNIGSPIAFGTLSTSEDQRFHRTVALTDVDLGDTDSLRTEFVIMDNQGLHVYQSQPAADGLDLENDPTATIVRGGMVMIVGDFDGDAVRLGPPTRQTRSDITQPLVVLNAPPIHFDIIDGQVYDLGQCFDGNCEHRAIYQNAQTVQMEVSTQVSSDWGVSQSIEAEIGGNFGPISASVRGSLERQYGEGFTNVQGSSQTVRVTVTSDAVEDDRIYATISNYDILEYPVYVDNQMEGHVIAVVPQLSGVESLRNTWFASKSGNARTYITPHEVGNIFSYRENAELPTGATFFGQGGFTGGGGDTWELSGTAVQTWELSFSSEEITERERSAFQQISRSLSGEIGVSFGPIQASLEASVSDTYGSEQISTHRTFVQEESALIVEFGTIDASILGTKTYTVSPYVYWAANGALVLDYAVSPDVSAGVASFWEQTYSEHPDLTFILPWKYDEEKGIGSTDPEVQKEETRDIIFDPLNPQPGETIDILARVQNFSLRDHFAAFTVRFYLGDPRSGGVFIGSVEVPRINARDNRVARLENWQVPENVSNETKIYVVIDEENSVEEVHENNNIAWNLLNPNLGSDPTSVEARADGSGPASFALHQNFPNPFNPETQIRFELTTAAAVKLEIFNLKGQRIATVLNGQMPAGRHVVNWDGRDWLGRHVASGVYLYRLQAGERVQVRKMTLLR